MQKPENNSIVIFGASGDLTKRKLLPALYHLFVNDLLPDDFSILGASKTVFTDESFREKVTNDLMQIENITKKQSEEFCQHLYYHPMDMTDVEDYEELKNRLENLSEKHTTAGNTVYYMATPPSLYGTISANLAHHKLNKDGDGWKRLIVEKPFGYDLKSANELDKLLHTCFRERQVYRIDHYLGKETVQNLLVFRFSNGLFEPLWNRSFIDYVEITAAESLGVEGRGGYYDHSGAVRDMLQNHLLQVMALVAMEPPAVINADAMRNEVVKVIQSLHPLEEKDLKENLVLGQYTKNVIDGAVVPGYREEDGVADDSRTATYVGMKMMIDNWRWNGVPFYVRTGKRMPERLTEIVIHFKKTPHPVFGADAPENKLIIRIQPNESIQMDFGLKKPGAGFCAQGVSMNFDYNSLEETNLLTAYERLLLDCMKGDATLFARSDAVRACWEFVQPILDYKKEVKALFGYKSGTWGPNKADEMLEKDGREWRFSSEDLIN